MDLAHTSPHAQAAQGRRTRFRKRFPIGPGYELRHRFARQAFDAAVAVGLGLLLWQQAHRLPLATAGGMVLLALGIDDLLGSLRLRWAPTWLLAGDALCRRGRCLSLDRLTRVGLEPYHPYLLRIDRLPVLRLVLEGEGVRWAVPLTHENWERLWERLRRQRPEMVAWWKHPVLLRALAQEREVPYHLPPGTVTDDLGIPVWARALQLGLGGGVLLLGLMPFPSLQPVPTTLWFGLAAGVALIVERKTRRVRVSVPKRYFKTGAGP